MTMRQLFESMKKHPRFYVTLTAFIVFILLSVIAYLFCLQAVRAERHARYVGIMNVASEKIAKTIRGMEMNAKNVFDEVEKHLDSPESVIGALSSKTGLNPEIRGYFAAFEPNYFPEKGYWFEPYVHHVDSGDFELRLVGSAQHKYHKSSWYVRAKKSHEEFWSEPYYYYDGTNISGHYTTFVKPIYDDNWTLICVCGADMTFEWLAQELQRIDKQIHNDPLLNENSFFGSDADFYTVVINDDGRCIAGPKDKIVPLTGDQIRSSLAQQKSGTMDLKVKGVPSTIYFTPIDHVDWSVGVIVAKPWFLKPMFGLALLLLALSFMGTVAVWLACRRSLFRNN